MANYAEAKSGPPGGPLGVKLKFDISNLAKSRNSMIWLVDNLRLSRNTLGVDWKGAGALTY